MAIQKTQAQLNREFDRLVKKERKLEEKREKTSLKSLGLRAKLNRLQSIGY